MASEATSTEHSSSGSLNFIACSNFVTEVKQEESYHNFVTLKEKKETVRGWFETASISLSSIWFFLCISPCWSINIYPLNLYGSEKIVK